MGNENENKTRGVEEIRDSQEQLLAIILRRTYKEPGINFVTPHDFSQQLGCLRHPAGKKIAPHIHNLVPRQVQYTQEVLFLRAGRIRVDFYNSESVYLESRILEGGDTILLIHGGHGFECLEEVDMIEVKQGPFVGNHDKTRFPGVQSPQEIKWTRK